MKDKTIVFSKEQILISKYIREFFGKGSTRVKGEKMSIKDIDAAIAESVSESNLKEKS